jgi:hypothetical protein
LKTDSSLVYMPSFVVFLALFFSSANVQPFYTSSFNPHNFLQEHCIEYVMQGKTHYFSSDFILNFQEEQLSGGHQLSHLSPPSDEISTSSYLSLRIDSVIVCPLLNSTSLYPSPVSAHIRFIKHQSFSDSASDHSFLI